MFILYRNCYFVVSSENSANLTDRERERERETERETEIKHRE